MYLRPSAARPFYCLLLFAFIVCTINPLTARREAEVWYFGDRCGIDFRGQAPQALSDSRMLTWESSASYSDPQTGELLFYTDGLRVWSRDHSLMPETTPWLPEGRPDWLLSISTSQGALVVPHPCDDDLLYVFNPGNVTNVNIPPDASENARRLSQELSYSLIDLSKRGGLGEIVDHKALTPGSKMTEKLSGTVVCDSKGPGYWVVSTVLDSGTFYAFYVGKDGVQETPVISHIASGRSAMHTLFGQMKISPDGRSIAMFKDLSRFSQATGTILLCRFDNNSGKVSDPALVEVSNFNASGYGLSFSPDSQRLYIANFWGDMYQMTLTDFRWSAIQGSAIRLPALSGHIIGALQIAPDGKIYAALPGSIRLGVINNPNRAGLACNLAVHELDGVDKAGSSISSNIGLPNYMDHLFQKDGSCLGSPVADFVHDTICRGQRMTFGDRSRNAPCEWRWQFEGGRPSEWIGPEPPSVAYETAGEYSVRLKVSNGIGCDSSTKVITVLTPPALEAGSDVSICPGESIRLQAEGRGDFHWQPAVGLSADNIADPVAAPKRTTEYVVSLRGENGCESRDTLLVTVRPVALRVSSSQTICAGSRMQLEARGALRYEWRPADGLSDPRAPNPLAQPRSSTEYHVTAFNELDCASTASLFVTVLEAPELRLSGEQRICPGDSAQLRAEGGIRYEWEPREGLNNPAIPNPRAAPARTTLYRVRVYNAAGCSTSGTVRVQVGNFAQGGVRSSRATICRGESVQLEGFGGDIYEWSPAEGLSAADIPNPVAAPLHSQLYTLRIRRGECTAEYTVNVKVEPRPLLTVGEDRRVCAGESILLNAGGGIRYEWSPTRGLSNPHSATTTAAPQETTLYTVQGWNVAGCVSSATLRVEVRPWGVAALSLPDTAVTPGQEILLPLELNVPEDYLPLRIERLRFDLRYDGRLVTLRGVEDAALLNRRLEGEEEVLSLERRDISLREARSTVLGLRVLGLISLATSSELRIENLEFDFAPGSCLTVERRNGRFGIHDYCLGYGVRFATRLQLVVQPNPTRANPRLRIIAARDGELQLRLLDSFGRSVLRQAIKGSEGKVYELDLQTKGLPAGLYHLIADDKGQSVSSSLLLLP